VVTVYRTNKDRRNMIALSIHEADFKPLALFFLPFFDFDFAVALEENQEDDLEVTLGREPFVGSALEGELEPAVCARGDLSLGFAALDVGV